MSREIKYEYRTEKYRRGAPLLLDTPSRQFRYRSLYGYGPDTAQDIHSRGNTRDLAGCPVYSDCIVVDCDTEVEAETVKERLTELDIPFELWLTGNRGCHFHIPIEPMYGTDVIWSQTCWLRDIGIWDIIDTSIYRENGQIRVPGAVHEKTGRVKEKVMNAVGTAIKIDRRTPPPTITNRREVVDGSPEARHEYFRNLMYQRFEGGRHGHMFILWCRGNEAGFSSETIFNDIRWWNSRCAIPSHSPSDVERKLRGFK